jgi:hypothetical protein
MLQIGEHLLALPQLVVPFDTDDEFARHLQRNLDESFGTQWLVSAASRSVEMFLARVSEIPSLSKNGAQQLAADIGYLLNVVSRFGVEDARLVHVLTFLQQSLDDEQINMSQLGKIVQ